MTYVIVIAFLVIDMMYTQHKAQGYEEDYVYIYIINRPLSWLHKRSFGGTSWLGHQVGDSSFTLQSTLLECRDFNERSCSDIHADSQEFKRAGFLVTHSA